MAKANNDTHSGHSGKALLDRTVSKTRMDKDQVVVYYSG